MSSSGRRPAASILLAAYDAAEHLDETLRDLLGQTFQDFELVAVDDGSHDATGEILERYAACDDRIVVVHNDRNIGLPRSLNRGLEHCRAPLVARADADDRYHPERLRRQVAFMDSHPEVGLLSCSFERIDAAGAALRTVHLPTGDREIRVRELFLNSIFHPGVVFRTELVRRVGGYDPTFVREDDELFARLLQHTRVANLPDALVRYRILHGSVSHSKLVEREAEAPVIRQPLLSGYLGREVSTDEACAMVHTFLPPRSHLVPLAQLQAAERGFREVLQAVRHQEDAHTVRFFREEIARAWLRQARRWSQVDPEVNRYAVGRAARWWPPAVAHRRSLRLALGRAPMPLRPMETHADR